MGVEGRKGLGNSAPGPLAVGEGLLRGRSESAVQGGEAREWGWADGLGQGPGPRRSLVQREALVVRGLIAISCDLRYRNR